MAFLPPFTVAGKTSEGLGAFFTVGNCTKRHFCPRLRSPKRPRKVSGCFLRSEIALNGIFTPVYGRKCLQPTLFAHIYGRKLRQPAFLPSFPVGNCTNQHFYPRFQSEIAPTSSHCPRLRSETVSVRCRSLFHRVVIISSRHHCSILIPDMPAGNRSSPFILYLALVHIP